MTVKITNHVEQALERLAVQFQGKTKFEALVTAINAPIQDIEVALCELLLERAIDTAIGVQLDALGIIVGQLRNGLSDDDYRPFIRTKIAVNRSNGLVEQLINISRLAINDPTVVVDVQRQGTAAVIVKPGVVLMTEELSDALIDFLRSAKAGGVRLILEYLTAAANESFSYSEGSFIDGALGGGATTIPLDDASEFPASGSADIALGTTVEEAVTYAGKTATSLIGVSATANAHADRTAVYIPATSEQGFGDTASSNGGKYASAKE